MFSSACRSAHRNDGNQRSYRPRADALLQFAALKAGPADPHRPQQTSVSSVAHRFRRSSASTSDRRDRSSCGFTTSSFFVTVSIKGLWESCNVARRRGRWAEIQRNRAYWQRLEQQARREAERREAKEAHDREQARRAAIRQAIADERERKRLYFEDRKAEAEAMAADLQNRIAELESVLTDGLHWRPTVSFASFKRTVDMPPFDPGGLDRPLAEPQWEQFAPRAPRWIGWILWIFGSGARYAHKEAAARELYAQACARHAAAQSNRYRQLVERRSEYDRQAAEAVRNVVEYNGEVDEFERQFRAADSEAVSRFFTMVLNESDYPKGFAHRPRALYRPEPRKVVVDFELPPQSVIR
jgi:restriction system protein